MIIKRGKAEILNVIPEDVTLDEKSKDFAKSAKEVLEKEKNKKINGDTK